MKFQLVLHFHDELGHEVEELDIFSMSHSECCNLHELVRKFDEVLKVLDSQIISTEVHANIRLDDAPLAILRLRNRIRNEETLHHEQLSPREVEVVDLIRQGLTNREISDRMNISFETVRSHRKNILRKISVRNTAELIHLYDHIMDYHS